TLAGKTVLLTGASRGIGADIARVLVQKQATVVGVARSQAALERVCAEVDALGGRGIPVSFDISRVDQLPALVQQIEQQVGTPDILINNAGLERYCAFQDYSPSDLHHILSVNLIAAMELTRLLLPGLLQRGSGHIVNLVSLAGKKGHPYDSVYSASKGGLLLWNHALRQELWGTGVEVSAICPGYVADRGMLADTGVPAPRLAGVSESGDVAIALLKAIEHNRAEVIVNQDFFTETLTKLLLATEQIFPRMADLTNRWLGVTQLNQQRIKPKSKHPSPPSHLRVPTSPLASPAPPASPASSTSPAFWTRKP
ncbi:MAG: SDR family NAD(P)-dependent oxidoreductase, partial [Cyanobacteria bacterium P01_G01_bin.38]